MLALHPISSPCRTRGIFIKYKFTALIKILQLASFFILHESESHFHVPWGWQGWLLATCPAPPWALLSLAPHSSHMGLPSVLATQVLTYPRAFSTLFLCPESSPTGGKPLVFLGLHLESAPTLLLKLHLVCASRGTYPKHNILYVLLVFSVCISH